MSSPMDASSDNPLVDDGTDLRNEYDVFDNPLNAIGGAAMLLPLNPASLLIGAATGQFDNMGGDSAGDVAYNLSKGTALQTVGDVATQIEGGDWASAVTSTIGLGVDIAAAISDPIAAVAGQLIGWMLEHVEPLRLILHQLSGEPSMVEAYGQTWQNIGNSLAGDQAECAQAFTEETTEWTGASKMAYTVKLAQTLTEMSAAARASFALEKASMQMAQVVSGVRAFVRDLLAGLAGSLVSAAIEAATVVLAPAAVKSIIQGIAKAFFQASNAIAALGVAISRLGAVLSELVQSLDEVTRAGQATSG